MMNGRRRSRLAAILAGAMVLSAYLGGCAVSEPDPVPTLDPQQQGIFDQVMRRLVRAGQPCFQARFVDEKGTPLDGVDLFVHTESRGNVVKEGIKNMTVDRRVDLRFPDSRTVTIWANKDGYYDERIVVDDERKDWDNCIRRMVIRRAINLASDVNEVQIVLQKKGELTTLWRFGQELHYDATGIGVAADFANVHSEHDTLARRIEDVTNEQNWPAQGWVLIVPSPKAMTLPVVRMQQPEWTTMQLPPKIRLIATGEGNGFVIYKPRDADLLAREMTQAPANGYVKEIELTAEECRRIDIAASGYGQKVYFYAKIGNRYAKGVIAQVSVSSDLKTLIVNVGIWLQPDGSRNLEVDEDRR
jgi:hypothetical protein